MKSEYGFLMARNRGAWQPFIRIYREHYFWVYSNDLCNVSSFCFDEFPNREYFRIPEEL